MPVLRLSPLPLARVREAFDDADLIYDLTHDGFRAFAYLESEKSALRPLRINRRRGAEMAIDAPNPLLRFSVLLDMVSL